MPAAFDECVKSGGKIITVNPKGRSEVYIHVCYPKGGGPAIHGEVRHSKDARIRTGKSSSSKA